MTPEYIDLCRRLNLPRELVDGDWWTPQDGSLAAANQAYMYPVVRPGEDMGATYDEAFVWLPREGDILDLLEAERVWSVELVRRHDDGSMDAFGVMGRLGESFRPPRQNGSDRVTALLRLLMAVRGVTSGDPQESPKTQEEERSK